MDYAKPTDPNDSTDQRLIDLEIKASFTEDALEQLNQVVVRQQQEIQWLLREVRALRQQVPESSGLATFRQPGEDLPPHY
jgi:SlyX protein